MPKTKQQKETEVKKLKDSLKEAKAVVFVSYDGLKVKESQKAPAAFPQPVIPKAAENLK